MIKRHIRTLGLTLIFSPLVFSSCEKFLDVKPKGKDIPIQIEHFNGMFNNNNLTQVTYTQVSSLGTKIMENMLYNIYMGDELMATSRSFDFLNHKQKQAFTFEADIFNDEDNACEWATLYQQIYTYNVIANNVLDAESGSVKQKKQVYAEARASRAFRYLMLAQYFGKPYDESTASTDLCVPIITEADLNLENLPRNSVQEVYDFVIQELEESCEDLNPVTYHQLRISQCAGYFFLGKAYWFKGDYEKARIALEKATEMVSNNSIDLTLYDYNEKLNEWRYNPETPYSWTTGFPANNNGSNKEVIYNFQYSISSLTGAGEPILYVKPERMDLFTVNDHRKKFFANTDRTNAPLEGYRRQAARNIFSLGADMPDLKLMLLECQARSSDPTLQEEALNGLVDFRKKRMPTEEATNIVSELAQQEDLIRSIVEERQREYMMTGIRWFDIRRLWNDPLFQDDKQGYTHSDGTQEYKLTADRLVYQIPPKVKVYHSEWTNNK